MRRDSLTHIYNIADYGARSGGIFDNAPIINTILKKIPPGGGEIIIPIGEYLIDSPLKITSNFVTIAGVNRGWRSNVDVAVEGLTFPSGGSKLLVGDPDRPAIEAPSQSNESTGKTNRYSSITIRDLMIQGIGPEKAQTGIEIDQPADGTVIDDVSCINLGTGISVNYGDAGRISGCLIAECRDCINLNGCIETILTGCHLGAQPRGLTCNFTNLDHLLMSACDIFPDGASAVVMNGGQFNSISDCQISGWYTGLVEFTSNNCTFLADTFRANLRGGNWPNDPENRPVDWGLIRVSGNHNSFEACTIDSAQPADQTRIHCLFGDGNRFSDINITGNSSTHKIVIEGDAAANTQVILSAERQEIQVNNPAYPQVIVPIPTPSLN